MRKITVLTVVLVIVALLLPITPLWASGEVKKAKDNIDMGFYDNAFEILDVYVKKNPKDLEANFQLGRYYLFRGNDKAAMERFSRILRKDERYRTKIGDTFQEVADMLSGADFINCQRVHKLLMHAYSFNPGLANGASEKIIHLGDLARDKNQLGCAEDFYTLAERYSSPNLQKTIARRYLYLAALGYRTNDIKKKVLPIVGEDFVSQIFPGRQIVTVFERTFTDADTDQYGRIRAVNWSSIDARKNDVVHIEGLIPENAPGLKIQKDRAWISVNKTKGHTHSLEIDPKNGYLVIWMEKGKDIKAKIKIVREIVEKPNISLLAASI